MGKSYDEILREFIDTNHTYWGGKSEPLIKAINLHIPSYGPCPEGGPLEEFRLIQNVYYDIYNNGGGNCVRGSFDYGFKPATIASWRRNPHRLESKMDRAVEGAVNYLVGEGKM